MSHYISVIFLPIEGSAVPDSLKSWLVVEPFLKGWYERRHELGLRLSVSRNWWHQAALDQICKGLGIEGLEFVLSEIICLGAKELEAASKALDRVTAALADGIPDIGSFEVDHGPVWWLRHYIHEGEFKELPQGVLRRAFEEAQPSYDVNANKDHGFEAVVGFYSFVKSLGQAVGDALIQKKCLLYVRPQP
jgi:hypothetical protein